MSTKLLKKPLRRPDPKIRDWKLYVIRFTDGHYYIGITSRADIMVRIKEHGTIRGAWVNRGKVLDEIIEKRHLGRIPVKQALTIENEVMLQYRKKLGFIKGMLKVRGGLDVSKKTPIVPTYYPGSIQSVIFVLSCIAIGVLLLVIIVHE